MKQLIYHIIRWVPGILLAWMTVANASGQKTVTTFEVDQCDTMQFSVTSRPSIDDSHFVWAIYNSSASPVDVLDPTGSLDPAISFVDGMYAGRTVQVTGLDPGEYYVRIQVWDEVSCTDNVEMYVMEVVQSDIEFELVGDSACIGDPTTIKIVFTGVGPYELSYTYGDALTGNVVNMNGVIVDGPEVIIDITDPLPTGQNSFWMMSVSDGCRVNSYEVEDAPNTGILIFPKPSQSRIYLKDD